jgi:hypothetical protein
MGDTEMNVDVLPSPAFTNMWHGVLPAGATDSVKQR